MTYDSLDRVCQYIYSNGKSLTYLYNARSLIQAIPDFITGISYNASGAIQTIHYANGTESEHAYDPRHRLTQLATKRGADEPFQDISYTFDGVSNILRIQDGRPQVEGTPRNADQQFLYDDLYRLTEAEGPGYGKINYKYDSIGNMIHKASPSMGMAGHIDDPLINLGDMVCGGSAGTSNRIGKTPGDPPGPHAITGTASGHVYDYDDNGNMIIANNDRYSFDYADRLVKVKKGDSEATYLYDYTGQRVVKKVKENTGSSDALTKTTLYINQNYEIREGEEISYVFAGTRRIAMCRGESNAEHITQTIHLYPGWNLISTYVTPENTAIGVIFSSIIGKYKEVVAYDPVEGRYLVYNPNGPSGSNELLVIEPLRGYLVLMDEEASLTVSGARATGGIELYPCWNLIGCPPVGTADIPSLLDSIDGKYRAVWGYKANEGSEARWRKYLTDIIGLPFLNDLLEMEPGYGYWVEVTEGCTLSFNDIPNEDKPNGEIFFYHPDHLGSSNSITDQTGNVVESTEFYPFGMIQYEHRDGHSDDLGFQSIYKFTGKERDAESGLDYFGARYYAPVVGRFVSVDPAREDLNNLQNLNCYSYCLNNPMRYIDPVGKEPDKSFNVGEVIENIDQFINIDKAVQKTDDLELKFKSWLENDEIQNSDLLLEKIYKISKLIESKNNQLKISEWSDYIQEISEGNNYVEKFYDEKIGGNIGLGQGNDWAERFLNSHPFWQGLEVIGLIGYMASGRQISTNITMGNAKLKIGLSGPNLINQNTISSPEKILDKPVNLKLNLSW